MDSGVGSVQLEKPNPLERRRRLGSMKMNS